jgi:hypothetical protein
MVFGHQPAAVTVLAGIRARLPNATVTYAPGPEIRRDIPSWFEGMMAGETRKPAQTPAEAEAAFQAALDTARAADQIVMVLGETDLMAGEAASRASLDLPGRQEELLKAVAALGKPVVLVLLNGRPLSINWAAEHVPAILEAWEPGSEGGHAVADILFGDVNPRRQAAGHLPAQGQPRAALLCAQPDPLAGRQPHVQPALLGRAADAALSLRLRPELHDLRLRQRPGFGGAGQGGRDGDGQRGCDQYRRRWPGTRWRSSTSTSVGAAIRARCVS